MVQQVEYNGITHEFPDEATPEMMSRALGLSGNNEPSIPEPYHTFLGDIPKNAVLPTISDRLAQQKEISSEFRKQMVNPQAGKQFLTGAAQGIANLPQDILNLPIMAGNYLNNTHAPTIPRWNFSGDTSPARAGEMLSSLLPLPGAVSKLAPAVGEVAKAVGETAKSAGKVALVPPMAAVKAMKYLNPAKITKSGIVKSVLEGEKAMKKKYSGPNGLYTQNFADARATGLGDVNVDPKMVDLDAISKNTPHKYYEATESFLKKPTIENAQKAVSDLGFMERTLTNRYVSKGLTDPESQALDAAIKAKQHIQRQMFTDTSGQFHPDLHAEHAGIQKGYANEVIPYTKNVSLQNFKNKKLTLDELIPRLSKGEFGAKRAPYHGAIAARKFLMPMLKYGGVIEATHLLDKLLSRH